MFSSCSIKSTHTSARWWAFSRLGQRWFAQPQLGFLSLSYFPPRVQPVHPRRCLEPPRSASAGHVACPMTLSSAPRTQGATSSPRGRQCQGCPLQSHCANHPLAETQEFQSPKGAVRAWGLEHEALALRHPIFLSCPSFHGTDRRFVSSPLYPLPPLSMAFSP